MAQLMTSLYIVDPQIGYVIYWEYIGIPLTNFWLNPCVVRLTLKTLSADNRSSNPIFPAENHRRTLSINQKTYTCERLFSCAYLVRL
jgi:hypothetical protein